MAIYHLHVKNISRSFGRSAVACAAYRAGEALPNEAEERLSNFGGRRNVLLAEILLPSGAPPWMADRAKLWNAVEACERRKDARLAKEVEFSLPRELLSSDRVAAAREMAMFFVARGHVADMAIHDDGQNHNPHCHIMLATRAVTGEGFGLKLRSSDSLAFVTEARAAWAAIANRALGNAGASAVVDQRSYAAQGIEKVAGQHDGVLSRQKSLPSKKERKAMAREYPETVIDDALPVPDPEGRPISQAELDAAQALMLADMERKVDEPLTWIETKPSVHRSTSRDVADNPLKWMGERDTALGQSEEIEWDRSR